MSKDPRVGQDGGENGEPGFEGLPKVKVKRARRRGASLPVDDAILVAIRGVAKRLALPLPTVRGVVVAFAQQKLAELHNVDRLAAVVVAQLQARAQGGDQ